MEHLWTPWRMEYILSDKQAGCIFCEMLATADGDETLILHRGELGFLVLNKYPYNNGHLMAVPYRHAASLEDLTAAELAEIMALTTLSMRSLRRCLKPAGFNIGLNIGKVAGAGVLDHVHLHVVPRWAGDTNFMPLFADVRVIPQTLRETAGMLRDAIEDVRRET